MEARATLEQPEELRRVLEELGERLGEKGEKKGRGVAAPAFIASTL